VDQALTGTADPLGGGVGVADEPAKKQTVEAPTPGAAERKITGKTLYAGQEWAAEHPLNVRMSIPIGFGRYYITIVAGRERRARARLALDRRMHPLDTPTNALFMAFVAIVATAGSVALFYLLLAHGLGWSGRLFL
jgi:hypothetical protein